MTISLPKRIKKTAFNGLRSAKTRVRKNKNQKSREEAFSQIEFYNEILNVCEKYKFCGGK